MDIVQLKSTAICVLVLSAVVGCGGSSQLPDAASSSSSSSSSADDVPVGYVAPAPGFIEFANFPVNEQGRLEGWSFSQHSSNTSYSITVYEGELNITRTGEEPWGKVGQLFRGQVLESLQGKTLVFSAEVKADFTSEWGQAMEPAALAVLLKGRNMNSPLLGGSSVLSSLKEPILTDDNSAHWQRYQVEFTVPPAEDVSVTSLEVSFLMTEGGTMYVRGPALTEVES
ncbi:hypothetical protein KO507_12220 [Gilvimarinus agarilyticus]|uniref:hypothetical protein n=1 Tax=Gilvimarinus sp. 2_MG-2023 TaxID=3062666 RepID=UPI001C08A443|nr:hypothetical protein [Gilvimarinus sp. 2_MG-2023]MBU2886529.1 hypothetical protein [Gilvimarinus agarilyticus]MDO6571197.1 hypothetical protein [Gilvimarinus sp. 2_MG-2023]